MTFTIKRKTSEISTKYEKLVNIMKGDNLISKWKIYHTVFQHF